MEECTRAGIRLCQGSNGRSTFFVSWLFSPLIDGKSKSRSELGSRVHSLLLEPLYSHSENLPLAADQPLNQLLTFNVYYLHCCNKLKSSHSFTVAWFNNFSVAVFWQAALFTLLIPL